MKKDTWKTIIQIAISILTAIATTMGVTSCMGSQRRFIGYSFHRIPIIKVTQISQMTQIFSDCFLSHRFHRLTQIQTYSVYGNDADFFIHLIKRSYPMENLRNLRYLRNINPSMKSRRFRRLRRFSLIERAQEYRKKNLRNPTGQV